METLYTIREAARVLRVQRETVYRYMQSGALKYVIVGKVRRIRESDLQAFVREPERAQ